MTMTGQANPWKFVSDWALEHVQATVHDDRESAEHYAAECLADAKAAGFSEQAIIKAAHGNLVSFMEGEVNRAADQEVERLVAKDKS